MLLTYRSQLRVVEKTILSLLIQMEPLSHSNDIFDDASDGAHDNSREMNAVLAMPSRMLPSFAVL